MNSSGLSIKRKPTREVQIGSLKIGAENPIAVQSMCATPTQDIERTLQQVQLLVNNGADLVRIAVDSKKDVEALKEIRKQTSATLVVDLQENYRLVKEVAPYVDKVRYNPGHLHHHEKKVAVKDKVAFIIEHASNNNCAVRIGVNFGSIDPEKKEQVEQPFKAALNSAYEHVNIINSLGFTNFVVSLKSARPEDVVLINKNFSEEFPEVPLHLGVTEAGLLPMGEVKTRVAFEQLISQGIGDTIRVSLTLPFERKFEEITIGRKILEDIYAGRFRSVPESLNQGLNIISCPSCARVENEAFVELAEKVREAVDYAKDQNITIAVMGCRVNGPGESDHADLGLWCAPGHVNLKKGGELIGKFSYDEILPKLKEELNSLIS